MNKPLPVNPPELRSTFVAASSMPWQRTDFDGIEMKILYKDEGRSTILFKMAPGAVVPLHEHTALEQTFMLEGSLEDSEGSVGAGDFVWRPGGNIHVTCSERSDVHLRLQPPEPLFRWYEVFHFRQRTQLALAGRTKPRLDRWTCHCPKRRLGLPAANHNPAPATPQKAKAGCFRRTTRGRERPHPRGG